MSSERLYGNWLRPQRFGVRGVSWTTAVAAIAAYLTGLVVLQSHPRTGAGHPGRLRRRHGGVRGPDRRRDADPVVRRATPAGTGPRPRGTTGSAPSPRPAGPSPHRSPAPAWSSSPTPRAAYGAVHDPRARRVAVTLRVASTAADLIDPGEHDAAVGRWERWLEGLGRRPEVAWVTVTVETAPSPGTQLREQVTRRLSPTAPADCRALMTTLADASPAVAARTDTRVTLTFDLRAWDTQVGRRARRNGIDAYLPLLDQAVARRWRRPSTGAASPSAGR